MSSTRVKGFVPDHKVILTFYIIIAITVSLQLLSLGANQQFNNEHNVFYTSYNNYIIFKQSFFHLINGRDLYIHYPAEYYDLYKYSPTFALAMGLLAYLPDWAGLILWNTLNVTILFLALRMLPFSKKQLSFIMLYIMVELVTTTQNSQSNAMLAGLMIGAFCYMERGKLQWASLLLVIATFIKVYGAVGFSLFLLYPGRLRFILYAILWTILMLLAPLAATNPQTLINQYISWGNMMAMDQAASYGLSVMGWLNKWFGIVQGKTIVTGIGILLFLLPFSRTGYYKTERFRLLLLAHMLIWVIIFNHKAESATFIIAMSGIGVWYFSGYKSPIRTTLFWLAFVFISLGATELFMPIRETFFERYAIKPFMCIVTWVYVLKELLQTPRRHQVFLR